VRAFVYFVQAESTNKIKIGQSDDVPKRMYQLQCASPDKLKLLGKLSTKVVREEELHERFHAHRTVGEWFEPSNEILCYIRENATLEAKDMVPSYKSDPKHRIARKLEAEGARVAKAAEEVQLAEQNRIAHEEHEKKLEIIRSADPVKLTRFRELVFKNLWESARAKQQLTEQKE
jgi:Meiotically up-regulated gene 113